MSGLQRIAFGNVDDTDKSLQSKGGDGKLGLNLGRITNFEFRNDAGKDNTPGNAVFITVKIGERDFTNRIYEVTRVFDKDNNAILDEESEEFIRGYNEATKQAMAVIVHTAKAVGVTQAQLDAALAQPKASFEEWARTVIGLVQPNFATVPVDVFLEYQWNISPNQTRTFLQLPRNMKGGRFLCASVPPVGAWKEESEWEEMENDAPVKKEGLRYVDGGGNVHPFTRSANFMESPKGTLQTDEPAGSTAGYGGSTLPGSNTAGSTSTGTW